MSSRTRTRSHPEIHEADGLAREVLFSEAIGRLTRRMGKQRRSQTLASSSKPSPTRGSEIEIVNRSGRAFAPSDRPKRVLVSFATVEFYEAQGALTESARPFVDGFIWYRDADLPRSFLRRNARLFEDGRGFGYFVWKPWVILEALRKLDDGDVLLYVDSGNLVVGDLAPLFELCAASEQGIVVFDNRDWSPGAAVWKNSMFTRGDCFALMDATGPEFVGGDHVDASYLVVQKRPSAIRFLEEFLDACEDYRIVSDAPSSLRDDEPDFVDHRHDQSVLSILAIKHGIEPEREPSQFGNSLIGVKSPYPQLFDHHRRAFHLLPTGSRAAARAARRARRHATLRRLSRTEKRVTWTASSS